MGKKLAIKGGERVIPGAVKRLVKM